MKVLSFVNMKGGVGKTTLAVNVADVLSRQLGYRVLLVDIDPQFNATQSLFSGEEYIELRKKGAHTISDIFSEKPTPIISAIDGVSEIPPTRFADISPTQHADSLEIILGNLEIYRIDMVAGQGTEMRLKAFLRCKSTLYDYVIIDTPPTPSVFMSSAILASDYYIVPIKPEPLSRVGIELLQGIINRISENNAHDISCAGVVITMADKRTLVFKACRGELSRNELWGKYLIRQVVPQRTAIAREQGKQKLILDGDQLKVRERSLM